VKPQVVYIKKGGKKKEQNQTRAGYGTKGLEPQAMRLLLHQKKLAERQKQPWESSDFGPTRHPEKKAADPKSIIGFFWFWVLAQKK
tara:strand:+ start:213 stop:470 length:258 start_codon:yes stop_codon:yes gene_type:complete